MDAVTSSYVDIGPGIGRYVVEIEVPAEAKKYLAYHPGELQVIFPPGSEFEVLEGQKTKVWVAWAVWMYIIPTNFAILAT